MEKEWRRFRRFKQKVFVDSKEMESVRTKEKRSLEIDLQRLAWNWKQKVTGLNDGNTESGVVSETGSIGVYKMKERFEKKEQ